MSSNRSTVVLSREGAGGVYHHYDDLDKTCTIEVAEDWGAVAEVAKQQREIQEHAAPRIKRDLYPLAEVPMMVYAQSVRENWGKKRWAQWLNDPDNREFRIVGGRA